jgi:glycosyltransferase involved in cell wall biosynthesis
MPAYNAEKTIRKTCLEALSHECTDMVVIVDDASSDATSTQVEGIPRVKLVRHDSNRGYGANQKTCYRLALELGADIVIMVHPDYQYTPKLIPAMAGMVASGVYSCVLGSRIIGGRATGRGMPWWRYLANRGLTFFQNIVLGSKLSEFHTGYRAYSADLLKRLPIENNSDDFVFDNQLLCQVLWFYEAVGEISCPIRYTPESSSIRFGRCIVYGLSCVQTAIVYRLARIGVVNSLIFPAVDTRRH